MVNIIINNILDSYYTNKDGDYLYQMITNHLDKGERVTISFREISGLNSSFVNSAFIQLLEKYNFDFIKKNLNFVDSNKQINNMILSRFKFETENRKTCV